VIDWGTGRYEQTAAELEPVAEKVIAAAELAPGERVLDIGCGTGNAALLAGRAGAAATGLDPAARLIEVARERAAALGVDARFVIGDAQALPVGDAEFDVVVSVFALIFAADPDRALAEALRVLRPDGRALLTAWVPAGPIDAIFGIVGRAVAAAGGSTRERFAWHEPEVVSELASRHGAVAELEDAELVISAASPDDYLHRQSQHPMQLAARAVLEPAGTLAEVQAEVAAALRDSNEDPSAFRVRSPYRLIRLRPAG
jgi:SAM-dependent methyltransferase